MSNISDQVADKMEEMILSGASKGGHAAAGAVKTTGKVAGVTAKTAVKGIVLLVSGADFTRKEIMDALKNIALKSTKDIKFSKRNIQIADLKKKGSVKNIDEALKKEVLYYFDKNCKKFGVEYNALQDVEKEKSFLIFFSGKDEAIIHQAIAKSYKDYMQAEAKKEQRQERRESVKAKLAFFRDRVAARQRDELDQDKEKNISHTGPTR